MYEGKWCMGMDVNQMYYGGHLQYTQISINIHRYHYIMHLKLLYLKKKEKKKVILCSYYNEILGFPGSSVVKNSPTMQEMQETRV